MERETTCLQDTFILGEHMSRDITAVGSAPCKPRLGYRCPVIVKTLVLREYWVIAGVFHVYKRYTIKLLNMSKITNKRRQKVVFSQMQGNSNIKKFSPIISYQFVIFKPLCYCFEETKGFDVKASFTSRPVSRLIR